jgi:F-type H+-transporting ATPase subunit epsilon
MADQKLLFELVAPERLLLSEHVDMVVVPGAEGDFGVLPRHAPFLSLVRPGVIGIYEGDRLVRRIFVAGGLAEVNELGLVVLAEEAIPAEDLDPDAARRRLSDTREDLAEAKTDAERERLERAVEIAKALVEAAAESRKAA